MPRAGTSRIYRQSRSKIWSAVATEGRHRFHIRVKGKAMKRIGNLFDQVVEPENLRLAFWKASRGKRHRPDQRTFAQNLSTELERMRAGLLANGHLSESDFQERVTALTAFVQQADTLEFRQDFFNVDGASSSVMHERSGFLIRELAQRDGVQVYTIMTNEQLAEMVKQNIVDPSELTRIEGIGAARIEKYGTDLLSVLDALL